MTTPANPAAATTAAVVSVDDTKFAQLVLPATSGLSLVIFGAPWCGPCKQLKPNIETIAKEFAGRVGVYYYDVDKSHTYAERFSVRGVPTILLLKGGERVAALDGYQAVSKIEQIIKPHLPTTA